MNIRWLQQNLPWQGAYTNAFGAGPEHNHFAHSVLHLAKAVGKLAAAVEPLDHSSRLVMGDVTSALADVVILALRLANVHPNVVVDMEAAVIARLKEKNILPENWPEHAVPPASCSSERRRMAVRASDAEIDVLIHATRVDTEMDGMSIVPHERQAMRAFLYGTGKLDKRDEEIVLTVLNTRSETPSENTPEESGATVLHTNREVAARTFMMHVYRTIEHGDVPHRNWLLAKCINLVSRLEEVMAVAGSNNAKAE